MGVHSQLSNTKRDVQARKPYRMNRLKKREKNKKFPKKAGEIFDPELMTIHHLRKRRTSSRANIQLSGKKKQKILKQLRRQEKDKNQMEVVNPEPSKPVTSSDAPSKGKKKKKQATEGMEVDEDDRV